MISYRSIFAFTAFSALLLALSAAAPAAETARDATTVVAQNDDHGISGSRKNPDRFQSKPPAPKLKPGQKAA